MRVHLFVCRSMPRTVAMTQDRTGANLPPLPPGDVWKFWKTIIIPPGQKHRVALDVVKLRAALASSKGYYLVPWAVRATTSAGRRRVVRPPRRAPRKPRRR